MLDMCDNEISIYKCKDTRISSFWANKQYKQNVRNFRKSSLILEKSQMGNFEVSIILYQA